MKATRAYAIPRAGSWGVSYFRYFRYFYLGVTGNESNGNNATPYPYRTDNAHHAERNE